MEYNCMEQYWIWLSAIEGIGPKRFYTLLSRYEDARNVWDAVGQGEDFSWMGKETARRLKEARDEEKFYQLFLKLEKAGVRAVTRLSEDYPARLTDIFNAPPTLYVRGNCSLNDEKTFAVVGSRMATRDGLRAAKEICEGLAREGVTVVSGMARGVDSAAHLGALEAGGKTVAVLGSGPDVPYPPENAELMERILDSGGAVVSELLPGVRPVAGAFTARNRIISGISKGVLLVEGKEGSGAMITVNLALEQGRDVFAVPGNIFSPMSGMPNRLIVDGAVPVLSEWEILEYYRWAERERKTAKEKPDLQLSLEDAAIVEMLLSEEMSFDEILQKTKISAPELNSHLTMLELQGIIVKAPGGLFRAYK